jgi:hypothetical protein
VADSTLIYEDELVRISWNGADEYLMSEWKPVFRKGEPMRRAYQACIDAAKLHHGAPWLVDASQMQVLDQADIHWVDTEFWPGFVRAGAAYEAAIPPQKQVSKMTANRSVEKVVKSGKFEISVHATREEALAAVLAWRAKHRD